MNNKMIKDVAHATLNGLKNTGKDITTAIIRETVFSFQNIYSPDIYPNINWEGVINELESHYTITIGISETLYNHRIPWVRNYKQNNPNLSDFPFWNNYKRYLSEIQQLPQTVIDEIDQSTDAILDGMSNPRETDHFEKKGLVIGYVQSGKTGNYVGLINKAIDVGYQFIVVLAGMHNNLRQQTQFRIDQGVNGKQKINGVETKVGVGTLMNRFDNQTQSLTTADVKGDFNSAAANMNGINFNLEAPLIAVIKKNVHPLKNMNKWLENVIGINMESQSNKAVLIIDDEADQASINNNFKLEDLDAPIVDEDGNIDEENRPTAINAGIVDLINKFSRRCYTGYTATPYANVLIPLDNEHHQSIFPEDFIVRLKQPSNYLGPEKYFEEGLPGIMEINSIEGFPGQLKSYYKEELEELNMPDSLKVAAKQFIVSGALRFFRGQERSHMSMLIHVSHLTMIQNGLGDVFKNYWNELKDSIENNNETMWTELSDLFHGGNIDGLQVQVNNQQFYTQAYSENESFANNNFDLPTNFSELRDHIRSFIAAVEILVVNGHKDNKGQSLDYHLYPHGRKVIAIGGNTMSRGLTLEGLHTSYFIRHARTFDTLMQMGRWFGYRSNYADLCRIITTTEIAIDFGEICYADTIMNENISAMIRSNASPRDFLIKIRQSTTSLSVTSKMGVAGPMRLSWAGGEVITNSISRKPDTIINNHNILCKIIDRIKDRCNINEFDNKLIFKNVNIDGELDELKNDNFLIINNNGSLDFDKIFEFYKKSGYETIDVVIVGRKPGKQDNYTFIDKEIGLAQRNTARRNETEPNPNHFKVPNGKLTDANYLSDFIGDKKDELNIKEKRTPSVTCLYLERPIITFVALDPMFFYSSINVSRGDTPSIENMHSGLEDLKDNDFGQYIALPYGISIATPSCLPNSRSINNNSVDVLVNQMVNDNIN
ncbi:endonuclease [Patiriisocius marinus]|uniref:Endonuclease n=1 Tax=Patiriisocius marinus TaxID=1397112 RepID=A0A5J4IYY7_9FLAO|nr:Z1 domain-containing protein [Patiriisocius marinus]GER58858.1 endonuclease [Patiriisocius marinus]